MEQTKGTDSTAPQEYLRANFAVPCPCSSPCTHLAPGSAAWLFCRHGDAVPREASICGSPAKASFVEDKARTFRGQGHALSSVSGTAVSSRSLPASWLSITNTGCLICETWQRREFGRCSPESQGVFDLCLAMPQGPEGFNFLKK